MYGAKALLAPSVLDTLRRLNLLLHLLFFCSGISGLIYQVAWVRLFGNVFGNTVYSASLVVAIFMLGLGLGGVLGGAWADRRYVGGPEGASARLRAYAVLEDRKSTRLNSSHT